MRSSRARALATAVRRRLSYANVMATFAAFMALGGVSYAAVTLPRDSVGTKQLRPDSVTNSKLTNGSVGQNELRRRSVTDRALSSSIRSELAKRAATGARGPSGPPGPGAGRVRYSATGSASPTTGTALDFNGLRISASCEQSGSTTSMSIFARSGANAVLYNNFNADNGSDPTQPGQPQTGNLQFNLAAGVTTPLGGPSGDSGYARAVSVAIHTTTSRTITVNLVAFVDFDSDRCSLDGTAVSS